MTAASRRLLVTGAGGFLGSAVVRDAVARGFRVRAMVRAGSVRTNVEGLDVEIAEADMRDRAAVDRAMAGVDVLFHVAADYRIWAPDPEEIVRNNVTGTRNLMESARAAGVERIVYTSSVATIRPFTDGTAADETRPHTTRSAIGAYKRSKVAAEDVVRGMIAKDGLPVVIVHPSTPIGPRDVKPTPTGRIIVEAALGKMPAYVDTGLNLVHVDDVSAGHFLALEKGKVGEGYILGGSDVGLGTMLADIARIVGRKAPTTRLPRKLLYPLAYGAEGWARLSRREPFLTVDGLHMAAYRMYFSSAKAERELGYRARPYVDGLTGAIDWFRDRGMIR